MANDGEYCFNHCNGYCCTKYTVLITTEDIKRILENTPLKPTQFLTLYYVNEEILKLFPKITLASEDIVLGLRQRPDGSCIFYLKELGLCGIHLYKPMVCRTYPFTLNDKGQLIRLENICPGEWYPKNIEDLKDQIRQAWYEMEINKKKIEMWNKKNSDLGFNDLIKFILKDI
ncbi:MAG: YkgJ family cysteine cluster protein [Candidatus Helarchaeota archaeon]